MELNFTAKPKFLVVVVGPTAVGKTDLCVKLAKHFNTEIISADSRQFYKELNIGTAKPTPDEQQKILHHFFDSHSITEDYNAGAFEADALKLLEELFKEHDVVIATGGSGLYVRALTDGLDEMPVGDPEIRENLNKRFQEEGLAKLVEELKQLDPVYYDQVDKANPQRVIRALEICLSSDQPYSTFRVSERPKRPFHIIKIGLNRDRAELYERIDKRMDQMLESGLLEEVRSLLPYQHHNALQTVGYKELFDFLKGEYDYKEAVRLLKRNSRRYAKRQLTWFRKHNDYTWFHPGEYEAILRFVEEKINDVNMNTYP